MKNDEIEFAKWFSDKLLRHAERKANLYDGITAAGNERLDVAGCVVIVAEELGEVASAVLRERLGLAFEECIDVAHGALLTALALKRTMEKENGK